MLQQQQNLGQRFGSSKMHLSPPVALAAVRSKVVVLLLMILCWLLLPLWDSAIILCFVMRYFVSILVLQSSRLGRERWLLCFFCLPGVLWLLCGFSSRCKGFVCSLWLWHFLIILTYYFWVLIESRIPLKSKFVWSGNTTITHCRPNHSTVRRRWCNLGWEWLQFPLVYMNRLIKK